MRKKSIVGLLNWKNLETGNLQISIKTSNLPRRTGQILSGKKTDAENDEELHF